MKLNLFILAVIILLCLSCKRGKDDYCGNRVTEITYENLTATSLELTRYFTDPAFDTIKFKSSKGDTLIWVKTVCDTSWYDDFKSYGVPGCPPYLNEKSMQITNFYKTIKGEGSFEVKHSLRAYIKGFLNPQDNLVVVSFLGNNFNFYEERFGQSTDPNFFGNFIIDGINYQNVFYRFSFKPETKVKGFMAQQFGLIYVQDSLNSITFQIIH